MLRTAAKARRRLSSAFVSFLFNKASRLMIKNMSSSISEERRKRFEICRECGAPNEPGMRQLDGSIKYACARNSEHIAYDNTDVL